MSIKEKISYLFNEYSWVCAYRKSILPFNELNGIQKKFQVVKCPKDYWAADPFLFEKDGIVYLLVEYTDTKKKKSALAIKKILPEEDTDFTIIYEFPYHTSYPCIFEWNGELYIIPETKSAKEIVLLSCKQWPYKWEKKSVLKSNIDAADCTPFVDLNKLYLMIYEENETIKLSVAEMFPEEGKIGNIKVLKQYQNKVARPGGKLFSSNGNLIMVRQPGIKFYGEKIQFVKIDINNNFNEEIVNELLPNQIDVPVDGKLIGVHTYNKEGDIEVIDLFVKKFSILKPFRYVLHRLRILGYGEYERDKKMRWLEI